MARGADTETATVIRFQGDEGNGERGFSPATVAQPGGPWDPMQRGRSSAGDASVSYLSVVRPASLRRLKPHQQTNSSLWTSTADQLFDELTLLQQLPIATQNDAMVPRCDKERAAKLRQNCLWNMRLQHRDKPTLFTVTPGPTGGSETGSSRAVRASMALLPPCRSPPKTAAGGRMFAHPPTPSRSPVTSSQENAVFRVEQVFERKRSPLSPPSRLTLGLNRSDGGHLTSVQWSTGWSRVLWSAGGRWRHPEYDQDRVSSYLVSYHYPLKSHSATIWRVLLGRTWLPIEISGGFHRVAPLKTRKPMIEEARDLAPLLGIKGRGTSRPKAISWPPRPRMPAIEPPLKIMYRRRRDKCGRDARSRPTATDQKLNQWPSTAETMYQTTIRGDAGLGSGSGRWVLGVEVTHTIENHDSESLLDVCVWPAARPKKREPNRCSGCMCVAEPPGLRNSSQPPSGCMCVWACRLRNEDARYPLPLTSGSRGLRRQSSRHRRFSTRGRGHAHDTEHDSQPPLGMKGRGDADTHCHVRKSGVETPYKGSRSRTRPREHDSQNYQARYPLPSGRPKSGLRRHYKGSSRTTARMKKSRRRYPLQAGRPEVGVETHVLLRLTRQSMIANRRSINVAGRSRPVIPMVESRSRPKNQNRRPPGCVPEYRWSSCSRPRKPKSPNRLRDVCGRAAAQGPEYQWSSCCSRPRRPNRRWGGCTRQLFINMTPAL
ncbi:hypothetical protein MUK42_08310 [Musa troglodytarum]|uniref:Uncharacterized protein n=1 Tax=Musa troglodytarum TaxID=320322 RepID=A0A9E7EE06_9LILI|nr:hypothetical protein MUK42_08310 [Musa troglodytarum]